VFAGKWMELKNITLSEMNQDQQVKDHILSLMWNQTYKLNVYINTYKIINIYIYTHIHIVK
jgi:hypothetical protein